MARPSVSSDSDRSVSCVMFSTRRSVAKDGVTAESSRPNSNTASPRGSSE
jgi:hypothetical protein